MGTFFKENGCDGKYDDGKGQPENQAKYIGTTSVVLCVDSGST